MLERGRSITSKVSNKHSLEINFKYLFVALLLRITLEKRDVGVDFPSDNVIKLYSYVEDWEAATVLVRTGMYSLFE